MRLLFLTSRLPYPPNRGDRLRVFNFIRSLSGNHEIHLVSFVANQQESENSAVLKDYCEDVQVIQLSNTRSVLTAGLNAWRRLPLQALYYRSSAMQNLIDKKLAETGFDVVYVHLFRMAPYLAGHKDIYRIIDLTDVISQELIRSMPYRGLVSKIVYALERPRIEGFERWSAENFEETWLISEQDKSVLKKHCQHANIQVVRNGVDTERIFPTLEAKIPGRLIMVGHMGVFHNVDAAIFFSNDILPIIRSKFPTAHFIIAGAAPNSKVRALASITGVEVAGFTPDLNKALNQSMLFVAPLRFAAGVQNKVLEAMASGLAVVTTNLVNHGLGARPGRDIITADEPEEIASNILNLLNNRSRRKQIGIAARCFVKDNYDWEMVAERMNVIQNMAPFQGEKHSRESIK